MDNVGYDSRNNRYGDMYDLGIVDPVKVVRSAIQNAASASGTLLTTEVTVSELEEEKE